LAPNARRDAATDTPPFGSLSAPSPSQSLTPCAPYPYDRGVLRPPAHPPQPVPRPPTPPRAPTLAAPKTPPPPPLASPTPSALGALGRSSHFSALRRTTHPGPTTTPPTANRQQATASHRAGAHADAPSRHQHKHTPLPHTTHTPRIAHARPPRRPLARPTDRPTTASRARGEARRRQPRRRNVSRAPGPVRPPLPATRPIATTSPSSSLLRSLAEPPTPTPRARAERRNEPGAEARVGRADAEPATRARRSRALPAGPLATATAERAPLSLSLAPRVASPRAGRRDADRTRRRRVAPPPSPPTSARRSRALPIGPLAIHGATAERASLSPSPSPSRTRSRSRSRSRSRLSLALAPRVRAWPSHGCSAAARPLPHRRPRCPCTTAPQPTRPPRRVVHHARRGEPAARSTPPTLASPPGGRRATSGRAIAATTNAAPTPTDRPHDPPPSSGRVMAGGRGCSAGVRRVWLARRGHGCEPRAPASMHAAQMCPALRARVYRRRAGGRCATTLHTRMTADAPRRDGEMRS